jgi:hypothetical protein
MTDENQGRMLRAWSAILQSMNAMGLADRLEMQIEMKRLLTEMQRNTERQARQDAANLRKK